MIRQLTTKKEMPHTYIHHHTQEIWGERERVRKERVREQDVKRRE